FADFFSLATLRSPVLSLFAYTTLFRSSLTPRGAAGAGSPVLPVQNSRAVPDVLGSPRMSIRVHIGGRVCRPEEAKISIFDRGFRSEEHRLNSSHLVSSYAVSCLKKKKH